MKTLSTPLALAAACLALLCAVGFRLEAATLSVTSTDNDGPGSLREALANADNGDTIDATGIVGMIVLTGGQLLVSTDVTILGPGPARLTVSGNAASRVFSVTGTDVAINGLTIANGSSAQKGAGISIGSGSGGTVLIRDCVVTGNSTTLSGGGVYNSEDVSLEIHACLISGNSAGGSGGGIYNDKGTVIILNSTLSANTADVECGGGIFSVGSSSSSGIVQIDRCTVSGNSANYGGGIYSAGGSPGSAAVVIESSTFSGNSASTAGAIYNDGAWGGIAQLEINASTFSGNTAGERGEILCNDGRFGGTAELEIGDTILQGDGSGPNINNESGLVTSLGYNLSSDDGTGLPSHTTDQTTTDPLLGPLQDNGGPTFTHALLPGSPAIDAGSRNVLGYAISLDQRGLPRTSDDPAIANADGGDGADIGAFEVTPPLTVVKQKMKLNFAKPDSDSFCLNALLGFDNGSDPSGQVFILNLGGASVMVTLDEKGRGATAPGEVPAGKIKLAPKGKTGLWALSAKFKRGSWQDAWAAWGLVNGDVPKPGQMVKVLATVQIGALHFGDWPSMVYTAKADKSGTAK